MKAMILAQIAPLKPGGQPLWLVDLPVPEPGPGEILVRVSACGVCHTELDEIEGRLVPPRLPVMPGLSRPSYRPGNGRYPVTGT